MKKCILILNMFLVSLLLLAEPPKPPVGMRWVLNPDFSDEFNGSSLDTTKWLDHHPTWKGRKPGLFMPSQISVKDGFLQLKGEKMVKDTVVDKQTYNVKCAAVVSKKAAYLGYYECRLKAAATTMSATFWFSSNHYQGPNNCDSFHQEWDIQECIGRDGDFKGSFFSRGMHSNAHYWYEDCKRKRFDHRAPEVRIEDNELASKDFHVYGGWWRNEKEASFYYDNNAPKHQKFYDKITDKPFNKPMYMRLVSETYPYPWIELPTDEELADNSKNTVYYDWVRGYNLVPADKMDENNSVQPKNLYHEGVFFESAVLNVKASGTLNLPLSYKTNSNKLIKLTLFDANNKVVATTSINALAGYANLLVLVEPDASLVAGAEYRVVSSLQDSSNADKGQKDSNCIYVHVEK